MKAYTVAAALIVTLLAPSRALGCETCGKSKAQPEKAPPEYEAVVRVFGGAVDYRDRVLRISVPQKVRRWVVDGVTVPPSLGFGGWLAFTPGEKGRHVMMGDLVLTEEEVNPVMSEVLSNGLEVTALHNHFFWESPRIYYMHVHGVGDPVEIARKMKGAVDIIGSFKARYPGPEPDQRAIELGGPPLDGATLDPIVGHPGDRLPGGVYKYTIGRKDLTVKEHGAVINARMGLNTWASFWGTAESAVVAGDVAMLENEVQPVLRALRKNGLDVVAIHHHMTGSRPMFIFLHYWGKGPAAKLATGFRAALDELGKSKTTTRIRH
jgi:hypothetical protein